LNFPARGTPGSRPPADHRFLLDMEGIISRRSNAPASLDFGAMRYSLVIFDCDGVLIDSEILSAEATAQTLTRLGVPMTTERCMRLFVGMTQADVENAIEREFALKLPADFEQQTTALLAQAYRDRLQPIDGVRELIERLPVPFCVASNSLPAKLGLGLSLTNLFELFYPHVYCASWWRAANLHPTSFSTHRAGSA